MFWNGYCPESWLNGKYVKMRLNHSDFFESEETGLQICILHGFLACILKKRGNSNFKKSPIFGHEVANDELLCLQINENSFFKNPQFLQNTAELEQFLQLLEVKN